MRILHRYFLGQFFKDISLKAQAQGEKLRDQQSQKDSSFCGLWWPVKCHIMNGCWNISAPKWCSNDNCSGVVKLNFFFSLTGVMSVGAVDSKSTTVIMSKYELDGWCGADLEERKRIKSLNTCAVALCILFTVSLDYIRVPSWRLDLKNYSDNEQSQSYFKRSLPFQF